MAYIARHQREHEEIERLDVVPTTWETCAAWHLIAELSRRNPGKLSVIQGPYPGSFRTVWFITEKPDDSEAEDWTGPTLLRITESGHVDTQHHHPEDRCPIEDGADSVKDPRFNTLDVLFTSDVKEIAGEVEACVGLASPHATPATVAESIGQRFIASALGLFLHTKNPLTVSGCLYDGVHPQRELLDAFPQLRHLAEAVTHTGEGLSTTPKMSPGVAQQISGLHVVHFYRSGDSGPRGSLPDPLAAVDIATGKLHLASSTVDLMKLFIESGRDIDLMAFTAVTQARKERSA